MNILTDCVCIKDGKFYYFTYNFNSLNYYDIEKQRDHFIGCVPDVPYDGIALYNRMYCLEDLIILTPFLSENICIYDISKKEFRKSRETIHCSNSLIKDGNLFFGFWQDGKSGFAKYDIFNDILTILDSKSDDGLLGKRVIADISVERDIICFSYINDECYHLYDTNTGTLVSHPLVEGIKECFSTMVYPQGYLVCDSNHKNMFLINDKRIIREYKIEETSGQTGQRFQRQTKYDGKIYLNYLLESDNYVLDLNTSEIKKCEQFHGPGLVLREDSDLAFLSFENNNTLMHMKQSAVSIKRPNYMYGEMLDCLFEKKHILVEESYNGLKGFVDYII